MKIWLGILLLVFIMSCDKAPTKPFHDLSSYPGMHAGVYRELSCALPQIVEYEKDSVLAEVFILAEDVLALRLYVDQGPDLWDVEAFYINDSTFYITPFSKDQYTWTGNLTFTDSLRVIMANRTLPCVILADTIGTVVYVSER